MLVNRDRAIGVMKDFGIDALLGTTPVNLTYLSDYSPWLHWFYRLNTPQHFMFQNYALLPRDESAPAALILSNYPPVAAYQAQWPSWIEDLYPFGSPPVPAALPPADAPAQVQRLYQLQQIAVKKGCKTPGDALVMALRDRGLTRGVIAVDTEGMQPGQLEYARRELPDLQFKEAGELFRYVRMVKTAEEFARLRRAAEINDHGMRALLKAAAPGKTELDLAAAHRAAVSLAGGIPVFCNNACGPWATNHWEPSDNRLNPGDTIFCDAGCTYQYYHADTNVVGVLGEPTRRHVEVFAAMGEGLDAATAKIRPGAKISEVLKAFRETTVRSGAIKVGTGFGHAIGLEPRDLPFIQMPFGVARDEFLDLSLDITLEAGMVLNFEDSKREVGIGSLAVEDTIVVTPTGAESLFPRPRRLEALPV